MFTTKHLDKVLSEVRGLHQKSIFSPKKSILAYRLSKMSSQYRGSAIERLVRDMYLAKKKKVRYIGGSNSFDMMVGRDRVEVKSSLATASVIGGMVRYSYQFQNIKTDNFDKLVMVFISPDGLQVRQMSCKIVKKYLANSTYYANGQTLYVGRNTRKLAGRRVAA